MYKQSSAGVKSSTKSMISLQYSNNNSHIQEIVESVFDQNLNWDVLIQVGPNLREFKCHKTILSFASDFFSRLLLHSTFNKDPVIILPEFDPNVVKCVLTYIYTGEINLSPGVMNEFLEVCSLLEVKGIIDQNMELEESRHETKEQEMISEEYTVIPTTFDDDQTDVVMSDTSDMEEEYVLEEDTSDLVSRSESVEEKPVIVPPTLELPNPIIIPRVIKDESITKPPEKTPPLKKVRLKQDPPKQKHQLLLEKFKFGFNEIEGSVGSWKHARLLADGTANINAANAQYFKERLEVCTAKIYENVVMDDPSKEKYKVRMYFCADPVRLKAMVECLMCGKSIQVSYKHRNGKFKQWINSNVLRHVETLHKSNLRSMEDGKKGRKEAF